MFPSRATRTIALLLALLHLVVGATGEALHYFTCDGLSCNWLATQAPAEQQQLGRYGHCHGPDFHWHVHVYEIDAASEDHIDYSQDEHSRYHKSVAHHEPHACPALSLVDKLREAVGAVSIDLPQDNSLCFRRYGEEAIRSFDSNPLYLARAPPA